MARSDKKIGEIAWIDLTIPKAKKVRDFYRSVVGWEVSEVEMGGYSDYCMITPSSKRTVAGVCHARSANADLPPHWLIYINVSDLEESVRVAERKGGQALTPLKPMGGARYCVIRDPAGAVFALIEGQA
jgi:predicted enzyme related to lactoylglutathione lyase